MLGLHNIGRESNESQRQTDDQFFRGVAEAADQRRNGYDRGVVALDRFPLAIIDNIRIEDRHEGGRDA